MEHFVNLEMRKKQWTAQTDITESLLISREKRKWQIALRRYVLEKSKCSYYAPYFGIGNIEFRQWIELQFDAGAGWDNFGEKWQLEHIVPTSYFDFSREDHMKLCWNFINIQIEKKSAHGETKKRVDLIAGRAYFEKIYFKTGIVKCKGMIDFLNEIERAQVQNIERAYEFFEKNKDNLNEMSTFSAYEFDQLNSGIGVEEILGERQILKKFGGE